MRARPFAGYLLLLLAVVSVTVTALDRAAVHAPARQQWRAPTPHQATLRLPKRKAPGIPGASPAPPLFARVAGLLFVFHPDPASLLPTAIFVPPRV
jgi:hypothetical protein